ncbi:glycosyltransferase family 4 protein [Sphaerospermopsis aphanizomenoides BCCUSP55]|uniref:glycosyltransferase family 4 protein n=1 Tax=Sphaerospermopsis aphanizomenoides TaxID=459663 RepID=UPI0019037BE7|nr:glycosyltransferase family 4 protein [Sphaerospermopsis aphanizomenoides]MBK1989590.1 glycosyltransferase family 4 protein [Sphaerospermopsis aphanizomenoides BCCUSP55]
MKLLVVFPSTLLGGTEEYALKIATEAKINGWDAHIAFPKTQETNSLIQDCLVNNLHYHPLNISEVTGKNLKFLKEHLPHFTRTLALLIKLKPNIIQVNMPWPYRCLGTLLACAVLNIPTVVIFHLLDHNGSFSTSRLKTYHWAKNRNQHWLTVSEYNRKRVCELFKVPKEQVLKIYNGTKITFTFTNLADIIQLRSQVRQELGLSDNHRILLTVARLSSVKGYGDIIPIIDHITQEFPDIKFVWVGKGEQEQYLIQKLQENNLENKVLLLGHRADVHRLLKAADLFIFPSHLEGLPFSIIEAMAHNLPVIASDSSSIPELITDRENGLLFPTGNSPKLLEAIRWAIQHPDAMQEMSQKSLLRVNEFSEERMVKETLDLFKKITLNS